MWDEAVTANINIDVETLEGLLGVPVVPTVATRGTGMEELAESYRHAQSPSVTAIQARVHQRTIGHHSESRSPADEGMSGVGS
jgi:ferrous iron transport protein B